ncbi:hypothetical protein GLOIN_2v1614013 [Rhizophagus irregularis DAOM 181602=DAOM 197198]|nr:hypothetical protein GLOIN_2v1614013 [Rhizophagus irregularis DAOM 181602=DAOM 197198]
MNWAFPMIHPIMLAMLAQYLNSTIYTYHPNYGFVTPYRIDQHNNQKKLISSATFTNEYSPKVFHTVAPYWPYPDMFIPHKYRNIIPKDLIYNNKGNFIIPGSREWFTYMYNLHQSGTIPIPILTRQVTQSEYYAEQDLITTNQRKREETHERINKTFGTSFPRFMDQSRTTVPISIMNSRNLNVALTNVTLRWFLTIFLPVKRMNTNEG